MQGTLERLSDCRQYAGHPLERALALSNRGRLERLGCGLNGLHDASNVFGGWRGSIAPASDARANDAFDGHVAKAQDPDMRGPDEFALLRRKGNAATLQLKRELLVFVAVGAETHGDAACLDALKAD